MYFIALATIDYRKWLFVKIKFLIKEKVRGVGNVKWKSWFINQLFKKLILKKIEGAGKLFKNLNSHRNAQTLQRSEWIDKNWIDTANNDTSQNFKTI